VLQQQAVVVTRGFGDELLAAGGQQGFGGGAPDAAALLTTIFQKIRIFSLNFCLKDCFKWLKMLVDAPHPVEAPTPSKHPLRRNPHSVKAPTPSKSPLSGKFYDFFQNKTFLSIF